MFAAITVEDDTSSFPFEQSPMVFEEPSLQGLGLVGAGGFNFPLLLGAAAGIFAPMLIKDPAMKTTQNRLLIGAGVALAASFIINR